MNTTTGTVLADGDIGVAREGPPPTGGNFLPLMHYGGWALFAVSLVGFVAVCAWMVWRREAPEKGAGLVLVCTLLYGAAGAIVGSVT